MDYKRTRVKLITVDETNKMLRLISTFLNMVETGERNEELLEELRNTEFLFAETMELLKKNIETTWIHIGPQFTKE